MKAIHRSSLGIFAAVIVLFSALAVFVANRTDEMMTAEAERTVKSVVKETTTRIDRLMLAVETVVRNSAWIVEEHRQDPDYMSRITQRIIENNKFIVGSAVAFEPNFYREKSRLFAPYSCVTTNGQVQSFLLPYDYPSQAWYRDARESGRDGWCEPYFDEGGAGTMICTFSVPLKDEKGNVYAVLTADVSLERMTEHIASLCPYPRSYAVLISRTGRYLVMPPQGRTFERDDETVTIREGTDNGWIVAIVCPIKNVLSGARQLVKVVVGFAGIGLLIIILFSWIHSSRLQRESALRERMSNELDIARMIQSEVVPKDFPEGVYAALRPFRGVGGDVYDFVTQGGRICFLIGDVSGSGIPAAIFSFVARMAFRTACETESDPGKIMERINDTLFRGNCNSLFMTAFAGLFDPKTGELRYSCAGLLPPVVVAPDGASRRLEVGHQVPMGVDGGIAYETRSENLGEGERFVAFTDGIVRFERADHVPFGEDRLLDCLSGSEGCTASETVEELLKALDDFAAGAEPTDDVAVIVLSR